MTASLPLDIPALERPAFFPGERIAATDLAGVQDYHRDMRWLHNRSLHDWGVALGLNVFGNRGDKTVQVLAGAAVDRAGREVLLASAVELQVPAVAGTSTGDPMDFYVTASYLTDDVLTPETRVGDCGTEGAIRLAERCQIRFQHPAAFAGTDWVSGNDLVLASVKVKDCQLAAAVTTKDRREIDTGGPYVASGATGAGSTAWQLWMVSGKAIGVFATVDTSAAGFSNAPSYHARLDGTLAAGGFAVAGYPVISDATATGFTFGILMPQGTVDLMSLNPTATVFKPAFMQQLTANLKWQVVWMGVEE